MKYILIVFLFLKPCYSIDKYCASGIPFNDICCADSCGLCGGEGCAEQQTDPANCCESSIREVNNFCSENDPPCIVVDSDPNCELGILSEDSTICCPEFCSSCGMLETETDEDFWSCSLEGVLEGGRPCNEKESPCVMQSASLDVLPSADSNIRRSTMVGIYTHDMNYRGREERYHTNIESALIFQNLDQLSMYTVRKLQNEGFYIQLVLEIEANYPNLDEIDQGKYDSKLKEFGKEAARNGKKFTIRILHEFNDNGYSWNIVKNDDPYGEQFKRSFRHVVNILRSTGAPVKFQVAYNNKSYKSKVRLSKFFPGDNYVDMVCVSVYNRKGLDKYHTKYESLESIFDDTYYQLKAMTSRPLCIAEMSTTDKGNKPGWIKDAFHVLTYKFTRVSVVNWFLYNKGNAHWDLNTKSEIASWIKGSRMFTAVTEGNSDEPVYVVETVGV
jgi:hypothetical protein